MKVFSNILLLLLFNSSFIYAQNSLSLVSERDVNQKYSNIHQISNLANTGYSVTPGIKGGVTVSSFQGTPSGYIAGFSLGGFYNFNYDNYTLGIEIGIAQHGGLLRDVKILGAGYPAINEYLCDLHVRVGYFESTLLFKYSIPTGNGFFIKPYFGFSFSRAIPFLGNTKRKIVSTNDINNEYEFKVSDSGERQYGNLVKAFDLGLVFESKGVIYDLRFYKGLNSIGGAEKLTPIDYKFYSFYLSIGVPFHLKVK